MSEIVSSYESTAAQSQSEPERAWKAFNESFPTNLDCINEIYSRLSINTSTCARCNSNSIRYENEGRTIVCRKCQCERWLTAKTFFHGIRNPRAWLGAIWLLERGVILNAVALHKLSGISTSTASILIKKILFAITKTPTEDSQQVPSSSFTLLYRRRSLLTPAKAHPRAEEDYLDEQCDQLTNEPQGPDSPSQLEASQTENITDEEQLRVLGQLSEKPVSLDFLSIKTGLPVNGLSAVITFLELEGLVTTLPGGLYVARPAEQAYKMQRPNTIEKNEALDDEVNRLQSFLLSTFNGISRKYLQLYVALWSLRKRNQKSNAAYIWDVLITVGPINQWLLRNYVSSSLINIQGMA